MNKNTASPYYRIDENGNEVFDPAIYKGQFYDSKAMPTTARLESGLKRKTPLIGFHITTLGSKGKLLTPMEVGAVAFEYNPKTRTYEEISRFSEYVSAPNDIIALGDKTIKGFRAFSYNGVDKARYLTNAKSLAEVKNRIEKFFKAFSKEDPIILTYSKFVIEVINNFDCADLSKIVKGVDLNAVLNELNGETKAWGLERTTISAVAEAFGMKNPVTACEKASFCGELSKYIAERLRIVEKGEKPKDTITLDDFKGMIPNTSRPVSEGKTVSDIGNLFSDKLGATAPIVNIEGNVTQVGSASIPHVSESEPYKEAFDNTKEAIARGDVPSEIGTQILGKLTELCKLISEQTDLINSSLLAIGKSLSQVEEHGKTPAKIGKNKTSDRQGR